MVLYHRIYRYTCTVYYIVKCSIPSIRLQCRYFCLYCMGKTWPGKILYNISASNTRIVEEEKRITKKKLFFSSFCSEKYKLNLLSMVGFLGNNNMEMCIESAKGV